MIFCKHPTLRVWILICISIPLMSLPFLVEHLGFTALFGLVPLFFIDELCHRKEVRHGWIYFFLFFLLWNVSTTYWIYHASIAGAIAAIIVNTLCMTAVFWLFRLFRGRIEKWRNMDSISFLPYLFFIVAWLAWEHCYFNTEISWPWLTLGNAFAGSIQSIQWYEYTGSLGGSLWILLSNILLYRILSNEIKRRRESAHEDKYSRRTRVSSYILYLAVLISPFIISKVMFDNYKEIEDPREFAVIQPNIEPYQDKFNRMSRQDQDKILFTLAEKAVTPNTTFVVAPETFTWYIDLDKFDRSITVQGVNNFIEKHPKVNFILGAVTLKMYPFNVYPNSSINQQPTLTSKKGDGFWYDTFNSSVIIDSAGHHDVYHKSKLVVLTEFVPFPKLLAPLNKLAISLGGATSSYGTQPEISIFTASDSTKIGTAICYESVYGDYYRDYVNKGAQVMTVITNDGWWDNTPGYHQHLRYSSLRAIEVRRSIARSANTGISALINQRGERVQATQWWRPESLTGTLNLNSKITFFAEHGDFIGRISMFLFSLLALFYISVLFFSSKKKKSD
jgi:apolipoprotein N-acyltransferase